MLTELAHTLLHGHEEVHVCTFLVCSGAAVFTIVLCTPKGCAAGRTLLDKSKNGDVWWVKFYNNTPTNSAR